MRTLNEVIKGFECCQNVECNECPYKILFNDYTHVPCDQLEKDDDALHYLKDYKANREDPDGDHQQLEKARALLQEFYRNDPLSWDELKQMEGKPVWYEHEFWKGWIILGKVEQGVNCEMIPDREERWYIVKDGSAKAYRKERE